jgi:hypothetical protein
MNYKPQVHKQIAAALIILVALYGALFYFVKPIQAADIMSRLLFAAKLLSFVPLPLLAGIGATVVARYSDSSLIRGYEAEPPKRFSLLLAYNSNTIEQTLLHSISVVTFCLVAPQPMLIFAVAQVTAFLLGRLLFFLGYRRDSIQRLMGFVIGYYPVIVAVVASCVFTLITA